MSLNAEADLLDEDLMSLTERHQVAIRDRQQRLDLAKAAVLQVLQETQNDGGMKANGVTGAAAGLSGQPIEIVRTALLMLETGDRIRWNGKDVHYELSNIE